MGKFFVKQNREQPEELKEMLWKNEVKANKFLAKVMLVFAGFFAVSYVLNQKGSIWSYDPIGDHVYASGMIILVTSGILVLSLKGSGRYSKSFLLAISIYASFIIAVFNVYGLWVVLLLPIIVSCRYYDEKFTIGVGIVSIIVNIIHQPLAMKFGLYESYLDLNAFSLPEGTHVVVEDTLNKTIINMGLITEAMTSDYIWGHMLLQFMITIGVVYISYKVAQNGREGVWMAAELSSQLHAEDIEAEALRTKITISQIQPHFLYNSLSAIMAIDGNPPQTIESIADFGKYLRENLNALTEEGNTPFEKELSHVERYVSLEKLRFGDRINVEYDIKETAFEVPPLSVQMMVENAIKHGLTKKRTPGTVWISTAREGKYYVVRVKDNGVGFDTEKLITGDHVGVGSVKKRVVAIPGASIDIKSVIGEGTECTIKIPVKKK